MNVFASIVDAGMRKDIWVGPAEGRRKKPTQDGTLIRELVTLRAALNWAREAKWINEVPHIEVPAQPTPRDRWLTREEADRLLESALALHVRTFLALALYTADRVYDGTQQQRSPRTRG